VHPRRAVKPSRRAVAKAAVCRSRGPEWGVRGLKNGGVDLSPLKGRSPKGYPRRSASPPYPPLSGLQVRINRMNQHLAKVGVASSSLVSRSIF
jgi:hypothetical protein